jgi:tetratricopeptide (TPR) repeat protein
VERGTINDQRSTITDQRSTINDQRNNINNDHHIMTTIDPVAIKELLSSTDIGELETAVHSYDDFSTDGPEEEQQLLKLRILLWNRIQALQQAAGISLHESLQQIGQLWFGMGETEKAVGQLTKAVTLKPNDAVSLELLGQAHAELSQYDKAIELHEKAIAVLQKESDSEKATALAYSKLANTYMLKGDFEQSLSLLKKAEGIMKDAGLGGTEQDGVILGQMGMLLERTGQYEEAVDVLKRAHKVLVITKGGTDSKTEEVGFLLEMTSSFV